jgi:hypothetical protein
VPFVVESPVWVDRLLTVILAMSLIVLIFWQKKFVFITAISSLMLLVLFDQIRLQPWVYQYFLLLVILALGADDETNQTIGLTQIIIAGLYFWSGLQKLNFTFSHETLPKLLEPWQLPFVVIGILIALIETLIGIGLFFRRTRNLAVYSAIAMHITILTLLIAKNYNQIVWFWNATLMIAVFIVFWKNENSIKEMLKSKLTFAKSITFAAVLLPILSFAGLWDMYLSGALYSGNVEVAVIRLDKNIVEKLPPKAQSVVFQTKTTGENMLPLFEWAIAEINAPVYPEQRVFRQIFQRICGLDKEAELIIKMRPAIWDGSYQIKRNKCAELEKP